MHYNIVYVITHAKHTPQPLDNHLYWYYGIPKQGCREVGIQDTVAYLGPLKSTAKELSNGV